MKITPGHFEEVFGCYLSTYAAQSIISYRLEHRSTTQSEYDAAVLDMIKAIYHEALPISGPTRHAIWEKGWAENLQDFDPSKAGRELAKPRYHGKFPIVRWNGNLYVPTSEDYEYNMLAAIQDYVFDKFLRDAASVYEFGCGTGHNLFRVRDVNPGALLVGLDWAESAVQLLNLQAKAGAYGPGAACAKRFDYFHPDPTFAPLPNSAFLTVASLEQVGNRWHSFFEMVMASQPSIVVHIEPIDEVLDPNVLLDHLSLEYSMKRGYLSGWLRHLKLSEELGRVKIHEIKRTRIGSKFLEGYTVVAWSPNPVVRA